MQLKTPNNLTPEQLNRALDQLAIRRLMLVMQPDEDGPHIDDIIGPVTKLKNTSVELVASVELQHHHRFVEQSIFRFQEHDGKFFLVQMDPPERK
jgi:hypothetical protein